MFSTVIMMLNQNVEGQELVTKTELGQIFKVHESTRPQTFEIRTLGVELNTD